MRQKTSTFVNKPSVTARRGGVKEPEIQEQALNQQMPAWQHGLEKTVATLTLLNARTEGQHRVAVLLYFRLAT